MRPNIVQLIKKMTFLAVSAEPVHELKCPASVLVNEVIIGVVAVEIVEIVEVVNAMVIEVMAVEIVKVVKVLHVIMKGKILLNYSEFNILNTYYIKFTLT